MPFIAPAVPTGMKAGVRTTPCGVVSRPVRACAVGCEQLKMIGKAHGSAYGVTSAPDSTSLRSIFAPKPLTAAELSRISPRHDDDHQTHRENQKHPPGAREPCARSRTIASSEPKPRLKRTGAFLLPEIMREEDHVKNDPVVAIAGVTGAVGAEFIATMDRRGFRVGKLKALASARSAGKTIDFRGERIVIEELTQHSFHGVDIALFSAGGGISRKYAPIAVKSGAVVVDNSSAFRMDPNVPLVIPEINANRIRDHKGIIANPNCSAITALVPLWPIHQQEPHQARDHVDLSGGQRRRCRGDGGAGGIDPRQPRRAGLHAQGDAAPLRLQLFSHNTAIDPETGYNDEETKVIKETRKIFEDERIADRRDLRAGAGAARALRGHHLRMRKADHGGRGRARSWRTRRA